MKKGIIWLPIIFAILIIAQFLFFSYSFTQVSFYSREVLDSNIVFEGDRLETYSRSIIRSLELSIAQSNYDFYLNNKENYWLKYDNSNVPSNQQISIFLNEKIADYTSKFIKKHQEFSKSDIPNFEIKTENIENSVQNDFSDIKSNQLKTQINNNNIYTKYDNQLVLINYEPDFANIKYERKIVLESSIVTVFGDMINNIRDVLIGQNKINKNILLAVGEFGGEKTRTTSANLCRDKLSNPQSTSEIKDSPLKSYLDDNVKPETKPYVLKKSQTQTFSSINYCNINTQKNQCSPCGHNSNNLNTLNVDKLYEISHGTTRDSAANIIKQYTENRLICLESELDENSDDYTIAFDGDYKEINKSKNSYKIGNTVLVKSRIYNNNFANNPTGGTCNGRVTGCCYYNEEGGCEQDRYTCNLVYTATADYYHQVNADVNVRYEENGFVYGFLDDNEIIPDNIKIIFKIKSGNLIEN